MDRLRFPRPKDAQSQNQHPEFVSFRYLIQTSKKIFFLFILIETPFVVQDEESGEMLCEYDRVENVYIYI